MVGRRKFLFVILFVMIVVAPFSEAFSRYKALPHRRFEGRDCGRDRIEKIRAIRIWKMTEYLELSEEQSEKFFPRLRRHERRIREKHREKQVVLREIEKLVARKGGKLTDREVKEYVDRLNRINQEIIRLRTDFILSSSDVLTPEQQMKLMIFDDKFRSQMMRILSEESETAKEKEEKP